MSENTPGSAEEQEAAELPTIRLKRLFPSPQEIFYFYDGEVAVVDGIITLPANRPEWVQRAYLKGFRCDPETGEVIELDSILDFTSQFEAPQFTSGVVTAPPASAPVDSAESAEESTNEGPDGGRQPAADDGVRTGPEDGAGSLPDEGLGSGVSDGAADLGSGTATVADLEAVRPD